MCNDYITFRYRYFWKQESATLFRYLNPGKSVYTLGILVWETDSPFEYFLALFPVKVTS